MMFQLIIVILVEPVPRKALFVKRLGKNRMEGNKFVEFELLK
jgi:hypothetical protein